MGEVEESSGGRGSIGWDGILVFVFVFVFIFKKS